MPQPTATDVHVDAILTGISVAYIQSRTQYVASQVFPEIPVDKQSDKYFVYNKGDWFRDEAQKRAPATESAGGGYRLSTTSYYCDVYAFHKDIDDQVRANTDNPLNLDRDASEFVTQRMLLRKEIQWANEFFTTGKWGTDVTVANKWDDYASSDPIDDVETGRETILSTTGYMPNTMVVSYPVYRALKQHPDIIDRYKYVSSATTGNDTNILAQVFGVDRFLVAQAIRNGAVEGATDSFSFVFGKHALLCYSAPTPGLLQPSAGYCFAWRGVSDGLGATVGLSRFRMEHIRSDRVEAQMAWDNKIVAADMGYFFNSAVS